jgi:DNA-binding NtrC family response regulator
MIAAVKQGDPPDIVLLDVMMPGMNGIDTLRGLKSAKADLQVIMLSGREHASTIVEAVRLGAADYVVKPDDPEGLGEIALDAAIKNAIEKTRLVSEITELRRQLSDDQDRAFLFWGDSPDMKTIAQMIEQVSDSDVTVLIRGESGVGKELVARAIHQRSPRKERPFVKVNCAALPAELLESELFGHEKGAFTGALTVKPWLLETADGGTVFLDEIGELPEAIQVKLLRVLEDRVVLRVGGVRPSKLDVRFVAATNRDLEADVAAGRFRSDLFFRLSAATLHLPPLRQRPRELPLLAAAFLDDACRRNGRRAMLISDDAMAMLLAHSWPGNVRELKNLMQYIAAAVATDVVVADDLGDRLGRLRAQSVPSVALPAPGDPPRFRPLADEVRELEITRIREAIEATGGNQTRAAGLLAMPVRTFFEKAKQYGLTPKKKRYDH